MVKAVNGIDWITSRDERMPCENLSFDLNIAG